MNKITVITSSRNREGFLEDNINHVSKIKSLKEHLIIDFSSEKKIDQSQYKDTKTKILNVIDEDEWSITRSYNVGIYYEPTKHLNFAITYRSQVNMKLKNGEADFTVPESLNDKFPDGKFTSSIPLPSVFTFALGIKPSEKLAIALDANYVNWKAYDTLAFDYENKKVIIHPNFYTTEDETQDLKTLEVLFKGVGGYSKENSF